MSLKLPLILAFICVASFQIGCNNQSSTEKLQACFDEMKAATVAFQAKMEEITDVASAEAKLPELKSTHKRLAIASHEMDLAEQTSSRAARNLKREIQDFKKEQKELFKQEFERLKSDEFVKAVLEPFLRRINAF